MRNTIFILLLLDNLFRTPVNDNVLRPKLGKAPLSEEKSVSGTLIFLIKPCVYISKCNNINVGQVKNSEINASYLQFFSIPSIRCDANHWVQ